MNTPDRPSHSRQNGFVLLALLATSAILLVTLAMAIPQMANQSQRIREEQLIDYGEQYQRAITLYFRKHQKYPERIADLEDTNGVRYLRKRYKDPFSESDEWRFILMGRDGKFKNSLLYDLSREGDALSDPSQAWDASSTSVRSTTESSIAPRYSQPGAIQPTTIPDLRQTSAPDLTIRQRYSQGFGFPGEEQILALQPTDRNPPDYSRMLPSMVPMNENQLTNGVRGATPAQQGLRQASGIQQMIQQSLPRLPQRPGQPGVDLQAAGSPAAATIQNLMTTPRSETGGPAGLIPNPQTGPTASFPEGIAGIASKSENSGIRIYNGREQYNEWEFVYDYRKDNKLKSAASRLPGAASIQDPGNRTRSPRNSNSTRSLR